MNKLIQTIKNIFKIEELRKRIVYTLLLLIVYRLGSFVVLPGVDGSVLAHAESFKEATSEGLLGLLNMFSGGSFGNASIFALGVMPYISASIVIQLLGIFVPYFRRLQMEGESGRRKMNQYTRYLTIAIVLIQGFAYMKALPAQVNAQALAEAGYGNVFAYDNIRWVVEDALKFVKREAKRGNMYNGLIMDPPAYGHGPDGEKWKLDELLYEFLQEVAKILAPEDAFMVLNLYSNGYSAMLGDTAVRSAFKMLDGKGKGELTCGELLLKDNFGKAIPLSVFSRLVR